MKKLLAIILSVAMLLSLAACGGTAPEATEAGGEASGQELGLVGFCSVSLSESIYVLTQEALEEIFAGKAQVQTVSCDNDAATQISQIKTFVTMGADLIIINPTDIDALSDAIIEAHNAGVKVYINGATSDSLSDEYYDCCTVSNEYLCGAYVALIAKNWIEAHADELNAANPNWELAFLQSSLSEETLERSAGEMSILEPYLKDYEGNYVDASGNVVDEANKVENPAYCQIAADHYAGVVVEQDQTNGGLNVANILTTNPNTRVFIAYNSLASTQGGQYIVDNYPDQLDEFAFFSAGVMGNEADYMVGAVSATDGVTPSVMRGACQFGVSAAGGEVADSVANTAYAIMYGTEGVDYFKRNPDGIAAWWTVDEEWGNGTAYVAHFNILSGATVQGFDPIAALTDENTVTYWNSRDGYIVEETPVEEEPAVDAPAVEVPAGPAAAVTAGEYVFMETTPFGEMKWVVTLNEDGTAVVAQPENESMGNPTWTAKWTDNGDGTFTTSECVGEGPQIAGFWENNSIVWQLLNEGRVTPVKYDNYAADVAAYGIPTGEASAATNVYLYEYEGMGGMDVAQFTLEEDGTCTFRLKDHAMIKDVYAGTYTREGNVVTVTGLTNVDATSAYATPGLWDWIVDCACTITVNNDGTFVPGVVEAPVIAAGEYTFMETTPFGEMKWVVTLNEDGTAVVAQPENEGMGCPTWTAVWTDNGDGTFTTAECVGDGPQIADFWKDNSITWTDNGDGTVTPVGYSG